MNWGAVTKINSDLNVPLNEGGVKIVKSAQRGFVTKHTTSSDSTLTINIAKVNPSKCSFSFIPKQWHEYISLNAAPIINEDNIVLKGVPTDAFNRYISGTWELIEYY